ncbi:hypothetical protein CC79DRAFT_1335281 [Sarocladium strictum]
MSRSAEVGRYFVTDMILRQTLWFWHRLNFLRSADTSSKTLDQSSWRARSHSKMRRT